LAKIISIGTAVPAFQHKQESILHFMQNIFEVDDDENRKLAYLYHKSAIQTRYSVIEDFGLPRDEWQFIPKNNTLPFPSIETRMAIYEKESTPLSIEAIKNCIEQKIALGDITHLITVSCTGMSAPGLDLQIAEQLQLSPTIFRTSVNFMGCYAAIHGLKIAQLIADTNENAKVVVVCTELCTLHFQKEYTQDNVSSSLLFADGSAAALVVSNNHQLKGIKLLSFYSEIAANGKNDMSWKLSSHGFLMSLSSYVADIIKADIDKLVEKSLAVNNLKKEQITHWCIHPGGKKILEAASQSIGILPTELKHSYETLSNYGNMSSPTILFVLKEILNNSNSQENIFGCAFGPGLTMETFVAKVE